MMTVVNEWRQALQGLIIRHPDRRNTVHWDILSSGHFTIGMDRVTSTLSEELWAPFQISTTLLSYFPGNTLARAWVAAAWAGYCQHEALELVTMGDWATRILDPHAEPYPTNPYNRGLRNGFPEVLTPETLYMTLALVISPEQISALATGGMANSGLTPLERLTDVSV